MNQTPQQLSILIVFISLSLNLSGQYVNIPAQAYYEYTTDSCLVYPHCGPNSSIYRDANDTLVLFPATPGKKIAIEFLDYTLDEDVNMMIYSGPGTDYPRLGIYNSMPGKLYSSDGSGAMTILLQAKEDISRTIGTFSAKATTVSEIAEPDLEMISVELPVDSAALEHNFSVNLQYRNNGPLRQGDGYLVVYISNDTVLDASDIAIDSMLINGSLPAIISDMQFNYLTVPGSLEPGDHYILAKLKDESEEPETDISNNTAFCPIKIINAEFDLYIQEFDLSTKDISRGLTVFMDITHITSGLYSASTSTSEVFFSEDNVLDESDILLSSKPIYNRYGGFEVSHSLPIPDKVDLEPGFRYFIIRVDGDNQYNETNELNNIAAVRVIYNETDRYDCRISSFHSDADTMTFNNTLQFSYTLQRDGYFNSDTLKLYLSKDTILDGSDHFLNHYINTNTTTFTGEVNIPDIIEDTSIEPGSYYILAYLQTSPLHHELDYSDNLKYIPLELIEEEIFDIFLTEMSLRSDSTYIIYPINIYGTVQNNGSTDVNFNYRFLVSKDSSIENATPYGYTYSATLNVGESCSISRFVSLKDSLPGKYYIHLVTDYEEKYSETNEMNNSAVLPFELIDTTLTNDFDLFFLHSDTPDSAYFNQLIDVELTPFIYGTESLYTVIGCYLSNDTVFDESDVDRKILEETCFLDPFYVRDKTLSIAVPELDENNYQYLIIKIDDHNIYNEENTENNYIIKKIYLYKPNKSTDLSVTYINAGDPVFTPGEEYKIKCTVKDNLETEESDTAVITIYIQQYNDPDSQFSIYSQTVYGISNTSKTVYLQGQLPDTLSADVYRMHIVAHNLPHITDVDIENNIQSCSIGIIRDALDLSITDAYMDYDYTHYGYNSTLYFESINIGKELTENQPVNIYLSTDTILSENDTLLRGTLTKALGINSLTLTTTTISVQNNILPGSYYIILKIDPSDTHIESDETNNTCILPVEVYDYNANLAFADTEVTYSFHEKFLMVFSSEILNNGNLTSTQTNLYYLLSKDSILDNSDTLIDMDVLLPIGSGESIALSNSIVVSPTIQENFAYFFFYMNHDFQINDSIGKNKIRRIKLSIKEPGIDLTGIPVAYDTITLNKEEVYDMQILYKNNGIFSFCNTFYTKIYLSYDTVFSATEDIYIGESRSYICFSPGDEKIKSIDIQIPEEVKEGVYTMFYQLDGNNEYPENDETNNILGFPVRIGGTDDYDITIDSIICVQDSVSAGEEISYQWILRNLGRSSISSHFINNFYLSKDSIPSDEAFFSKLETGKDMYYGRSSISYSHNTLIPYNTEPGDYFLIISTDAEHDIAESNEENNIKAIPIHIMHANIDFINMNPKISPQAFLPGSEFTASCFNLQGGPSRMPISTYIPYFSILISKDTIADDNDMVLRSAKHLLYRPYSQYTFKMNFSINSITPGKYYLIFYFDMANEYAEIDESNNMSFVEFEVLRPLKEFDYAFSGLQCSVDYDSIYIRSDLQNTGTLVSEIHALTGFYFSNDTVLDPDDIHVRDLPIPEISANSSVYQNSVVAAGDEHYKYLIVKHDVEDIYFEANEKNNSGYCLIPEFTYDLDIQVAFDYDSILAGDTILPSIQIKNIGPTASDSSEVFAYIFQTLKSNNTNGFVFHDTIGKIKSHDRLIIEPEIVVPDSIPSREYILLFSLDETNPRENYLLNNTDVLSVWISNPFYTVLRNEYKELVVYPNPVEDWLAIKLSFSETIIDLYDTKGILIFNQEVHSSEVKLFLGNIPPGTYFLITSHNEVAKIIKR